MASGDGERRDVCTVPVGLVLSCIFQKLQVLLFQIQFREVSKLKIL